MPSTSSPSPDSFPTRRRFIVAAIVAPVAVAAACGGDDDGATDKIVLGDAANPPVGGAAEDADIGSEVDFAFTRFDGATDNFTSYAGTPLVINFFAAWCPPCVAEMPEFEEVSRELGDSVAFVGISIDAALSDAEELVTRTGVTYDLGWDPESRLFEEFGGFGMPTTILVHGDGTINEVWSGRLTKSDLTAKIAELT